MSFSALNSTAVNPTTDPALFANHNREILEASVILLVLPTFVVALRLLSRWMSGAGLWVGAERASPYHARMNIDSVISGMIIL